MTHLDDFGWFGLSCVCICLPVCLSVHISVCLSLCVCVSSPDGHHAVGDRQTGVPDHHDEDWTHQTLPVHGVPAQVDSIQNWFVNLFIIHLNLLVKINAGLCEIKEKIEKNPKLRAEESKIEKINNPKNHPQKSFLHSSVAFWCNCDWWARLIAQTNQEGVVSLAWNDQGVG